MDLMRQLQENDLLEQALQEAMRTGNLENIDPDKLAELLGDDAKRVWEQLDQLRQMLKDAGYLSGDDKMDLTARGIRRIGQKALKEIFVNLQKRPHGRPHDGDPGSHRGPAGRDQSVRVRATRSKLDLLSTLKNAVIRGGPELPVRMQPQDFEIYRNEHMTRTASVILLDQSRSMGLFNNFLAAKKVPWH